MSEPIRDLAFWSARAAAARPEAGAFSAGRYAPAASGATFDRISPVDGRMIARVALELGGKSPQVVLADWADLDAAASGVAWGVFHDQGETCHAGTRLIVEEKIREPLLERIEKVADGIAVGHALDPQSAMGAMIDEAHMSRVLGYVERAQSDGARLAFGGHRVLAETGGFYVEATVLDGVENADRVAQEEIFGPVLACIPVHSPAEALAAANDSIYGLAASVWTADRDLAHMFSR